MKRTLSLIFVLALFFALFGCSEPPAREVNSGVTVTDALGNRTTLASDARVVSCYGSFADCWILSGGMPVGVTDDAVEEGIVSSDAVTVVGSVKSVDMEKVISLNPDYVILSADLAAHLKLEGALKAARIPYGYFRVDTFADYKAMMEQFCAVHGRQDLYRTNVLEVESRIEQIRSALPDSPDKTFLLMRVYSTGMKAKGEDNLAGKILAEFGLRNVAEGNPSLLEDLSVEQVVLSDPDYIFALAMGDSLAAEEFLRQNVEEHPAWSGLSAVREGSCQMLPKDLFHYKPNERWDESYEYLAKIIFPELFG